MRTTLTLDDDLARRLREEARRTGKPFKQVVNEAIRRGLAAPEGGGTRRKFHVKASPRGFRAGIDLGRLNQLSTSWSSIALRRSSSAIGDEPQTVATAWLHQPWRDCREPHDGPERHATVDEAKPWPHSAR